MALHSCNYFAIILQFFCNCFAFATCLHFYYTQKYLNVKKIFVLTFEYCYLEINCAVNQNNAGKKELQTPPSENLKLPALPILRYSLPDGMQSISQQQR